MLGLGIKGVLRSFLLYPAVEQGRLAALDKGCVHSALGRPFSVGESLHLFSGRLVHGKVGEFWSVDRYVYFYNNDNR